MSPRKIRRSTSGGVDPVPYSVQLVTEQVAIAIKRERSCVISLPCTLPISEMMLLCSARRVVAYFAWAIFGVDGSMRPLEESDSKASCRTN
jgi:hypothetical protein